MIQKSKAILCAVLIFIYFLAGCGDPKSKQNQENPIKADFFTIQQGMPNDFITSLAFFGGQIWAGTKSGLTKYDGVNWQIFVKKNTNSLGSDIIESLLVADNALWIATDKGVSRYDGNNWSGVLSGARARAVAVKGNQIAVATAHGVDYSTGNPFESFGKENGGLVYDEVKYVAFDPVKSNLWVGTQAGMALFNGGTFQNFTGPAKSVMGNSLIDVPPSPANCQLIGNNINCIIPYKTLLAIGTTSGLSITDMGNQWTNYTAPHKDWVQRGGKIIEEMVSGNCPLPANFISSLAATSGDSALFVGTNNGLALLKESTWVDLSSKLSQLKSVSITALAIEKDNLWVGTQKGLYRITGISTLLN